MTAAGEKMCILAEIIRITIRGATRDEISAELSLTPEQTVKYVRFLQNRQLLVRVKGDDYYSPGPKGLAYLAVYDDAADLIDVEPDAYYSGEKAPGAHRSVYWDKAEISARMREIIDR